jgi:hypothetical protein
VLGRVLGDLDQRGDRRGLAHALAARHRRAVVVEREPLLLPVGVRERAR